MGDVSRFLTVKPLCFKGAVQVNTPNHLYQVLY